MPNIVIVGGGFAGVWAALAAARVRRKQSFRGRNLGIHLVSRDPWLTIRPRLYESSLDDARVALEEILTPAGVEYVSGDVTHIDTASQGVVVTTGSDWRTLSYDRLVLAAGSRTHRAPLDGIEHALGIDTYLEAAALEYHLASLRRVDGEGLARTSDSRFSAVVIGAGFTGIEVATTLVSRIRSAAGATRGSKQARVSIVDRAPVVAPDLGAAARRHVEAALASLGIAARLGVAATSITPEGVRLDSGEWLPAATTVWTGGMRASELAGELGVPRDDLGRVSVDEFLRVRGVAAAYAAGDVARAVAEGGEEEHIAPMSCQCAIPMGEIAGRNAAADLLGLPRERFSHTQYVTCLDLGDAGALFMEGWSREPRLTGYWAKVMKETINTRLIYPPRFPATRRLTTAA